MPNSQPTQDPTQLLDDLRTSTLSQLLVAGTIKFDVGTALDNGPLNYSDLCESLQLADRAATVLLTGLRSLGLIDITEENLVDLTDYGYEKLSPNSRFNLRGYIGLGAFSADTQYMIACLANDAPAGDVSFVYHEDGGASALDDPETSDALTRAMAARAANVAPFVPEHIDLSSSRHLIDVGGGHGLYSLHLLSQYPNLRASILDREPPLKVAKEYAQEMELSDRVELAFCDIHTHQIGDKADVILMANILHDYNAADAQRLVAHYAGQLADGGRLLILDAFLDPVDTGAPPISTGPRPVAAYSAMLFSICEGRCYRLDEYQAMMTAAGLAVDPNVAQVPARGSILTGWRNASV